MVFLEDCVAIVLLLVLGTALAEHGYIQFASIMLALPLVDQIGQAFVAIVNFPVLVKEVSPNAERIFEIISLPKAEDEWRQEKSEESSQWDDQGRGDGPGAIGFDNVSFCYGRRKILQGVSFVIPRGQKVALVGESGGGKSTIIKLILGVIQSEEGSIRVNGKRIDAESLERLRGGISYVPQSSTLFQTTLEKNITLCEEAAEDTRLITSVKCSGAEEVVNGTEKGFLTVFGRDVSALSGGQVQRICLARALYRDVPILLMDEPTSALDAKNEELFRQTLLRIEPEKTLLVVTHRLNLTKDFGRIMVLSEGKIVEEGTHTELLASNGVYRSLWDRTAAIGVPS